MTKPKSEMTPEELAKLEEEEFNTGPLSVLTQSVKNNTQVIGTNNCLIGYNEFIHTINFIFEVSFFSNLPTVLITRPVPPVMSSF